MEKKKVNKSIIYMISGIVVLLLAIAGSAYAYYSASATGEIVGSAAGAGLELTIEKLSTSANDALIPLDNTADMLSTAAKGYGNNGSTFDASKSCIDKNGYSVCQVYKITISNISTVPVVLNGGVSLTGTNTPNIECSKMDSSTSVTDNTSCIGGKTLANNYTLNAGSSNDYYVIVYIKNLDEEQEDIGDFNGVIIFTSTQGSKIYAKFKDDPALDTLTNLGLSVDTTHTPDFTTVSGNNGEDNNGNTGLGDSTKGIYEAEDDLGTSYYFRGAVENNYVYFAKNWWQIVRINGDGTIRMVTADVIGYSRFNNSYNDNAYVGYMYGTPGSSTYEKTHANTNNSTIKTYIDAWYQDNLSSYSSYIADAIYCNDRSVVTVNDIGGLTLIGNGAGMEESAYASFNRTYVDHSPSLKCSNKNDRFTVSSSLGNEALTYPIGLLTSDEVVMGGGVGVDLPTMTYIENENYYLYKNNIYWTMTPFDFAGGYARVDIVYRDGGLSYSRVSLDYGVRPVVSLKSDAITGGSGTKEKPFYVNEVPSGSYVPGDATASPE